VVTLATRLVSDLATIFNTDHLAVTATITKQGGGVITAPVHYEQEWVSAGAAEWGADVGMPQEVFFPHPVMFAKTSDLTGVTRGDDVSVSGASYNVKELQDDTTGVTMVVLWQQ